MNDKLQAALVVGAIAGGLGIVSLPWTAPHLDRETYTGVVTGKDRIPDEGYRVSLRFENGKTRTFINQDSYLEFKFNSADIQGALELGKTCSVKTYGFRIPFWSTFENIIAVGCPSLEK